MKVLAWVPQPFDTSPGQRFRLEQWDPYLRACGVELNYSPFADETLNLLLKTPGRIVAKCLGLARALGRRLQEATRLSGVDLVYVFREDALLGPALPVRTLTRRGIPFVFDFDDAVWVRYRSPVNSYFSYLRLPGKTATYCRQARHVLAGNDLLRRYALCHGAEASIVPTTIDTSKYRVVRRVQPTTPTIGWTGSYSTEAHLDVIRPALEALARRRTFRVVVVGGGRFRMESVPVVHRPWQSATEVVDLADFDIGVMPLPDSPWERGKCGLKALQYMALGIPPVVSPVGANSTIVEHGVSGYLATTTEEWICRLEELLDDTERRRALGLAARSRVEATYSACAVAPRVHRILDTVAGHLNRAAATATPAHGRGSSRG